MMPVIEGMNSEAMPMVEKIAPNPVPDQCLFWNQYAPMVSSHAPQMKNCRKFITIRRSLMLTRGFPLMVLRPQAGKMPRPDCSERRAAAHHSARHGPAKLPRRAIPGGMMALSLSIRHRLLLSHLFAVVVLAGAFGAFVYYMAAQQVVERMRVQLTNSVTVLRNRSTTTPWMRRRATRPHSARWSHGCRP